MVLITVIPEFRTLTQHFRKTEFTAKVRGRIELGVGVVTTEPKILGVIKNGSL